MLKSLFYYFGSKILWGFLFFLFCNVYFSLFEFMISLFLMLYLVAFELYDFVVVEEILLISFRINFNFKLSFLTLSIPLLALTIFLIFKHFLHISLNL